MESEIEFVTVIGENTKGITFPIFFCYVQSFGMKNEAPAAQYQVHRGTVKERHVSDLIIPGHRTGDNNIISSFLCACHQGKNRRNFH